ncbi:MAG: hypothetical protein K0R17_3418 [Rariglobus sp.]|jgi:hypothetical protein|nr:hypothetical protein [Rariglobus sp.]
MRIAWILGWAVPEAWFSAHVRAVFPHAEHGFFAASPTWLAQVCASGPWDAIAGHSLGTLLLLKEARTVSRLTPRVALLAPVLAFPSEAGLGGKVAGTQVKYLVRWLKTDRPAALADFYMRAGLSHCGAESMPAPLGLLQWGLERLATERADPPLPAGWRAYVGRTDALLDAPKLAGLLPSITCVDDATHHPEALIRAWAADFS